MYQSTAKVKIKMPLYLHILWKKFHIKIINSWSFAALALCIWSFTTVVKYNFHPQDHCTTKSEGTPTKKPLCCLLAQDRRYRLCSCLGSVCCFKKPEAGRAPCKEEKRRRLALLKQKHHLKGRCSSNNSVWLPRERQAASLTQPLLTAVLTSCLMFCLFQKSSPSSFFKEKWEFLRLEIFWSSMGSSLWEDLSRSISESEPG